MRQDDYSDRWLRRFQAIQDRGRSDGPFVKHGDPRRHPLDGELKRAVVQIRTDDLEILAFPQNLCQTPTHECIERAKYDGDTPFG